MNKNAYRGHRFPPAIIQLTVWMYDRCCLRSQIAQWVAVNLQQRDNGMQDHQQGTEAEYISSAP